MNKEKAEKWLRIVCKLRSYYEGEDNNSRWNCPLCDITKNRLSGNTQCGECLWVLFSKQKLAGDDWPCGEYASRHSGLDIAYLRSHRNPKWVRLSIARLKRWEKRLIEIIKATP